MTTTILWIYLWTGATTAGTLLGIMAGLSLVLRYGKGESRNVAVELRREIDQIPLTTAAILVFVLLLWPHVWYHTACCLRSRS